MSNKAIKKFHLLFLNDTQPTPLVPAGQRTDNRLLIISQRLMFVELVSILETVCRVCGDKSGILSIYTHQDV